MAVFTIDLAIESFLQERKAAGRENKTLQWHQTALRSFQQHFAQHDKRFPQEITTAEVRNWLVHLRAKPSDTGMQRSASTVQNYARSARAFCHWSVRQGYLERTPFVRGAVPKAGYHPIQMMEPDIFEQLLQACGPLSELMDHATARNRAILWLLLETGLLLSEVCALRLVDVDREQGRLTIRGNGSKARQILLRDNALRSLHCYLDQYRPQRGEIVAKEASIFLSEIGQPLTTNAITLLLLRLSSRAGITDKQVKSSLFRDTFAVRYLQEGGDPKILQKLLGFTNKAALKRYQEAARSFPHRTPVPGIPEQVLS
jgi:site-specific recombinase XerD